MQLSLRLSAVAAMVTPGNRLVDVGCDHGYLPVYLYLNDVIPKAVAMDVRPGPLSRAKEHIAQYQLEDYIETRLSDGLEALAPGEGDTLVIAGKGGPLMERILTKGSDVRESFREMILQPQSDIPHFRRFIREIGWEIDKEDLVLEDGKFYPMMHVVPGTGAVSAIDSDAPYSQEELFGGLLLEKHHPVLRQFLERELQIKDAILENMQDVQSDAAIGRRRQVEEERAQILLALDQYEKI